MKNNNSPDNMIQEGRGWSFKVKAYAILFSISRDGFNNSLSFENTKIITHQHNYLGNYFCE